jgi:hypothetical protein
MHNSTTTISLQYHHQISPSIYLLDLVKVKKKRKYKYAADKRRSSKRSVVGFHPFNFNNWRSSQVSSTTCAELPFSVLSLSSFPSY